MEIASYSMLIAAAEICDEPEIQQACEQNLREEEEMASWLEENLPAITLEFLARVARDSDAAKR